MTKRDRLKHQLLWAKLKLCEAQKNGCYREEEAWHGYIQALQWVQDDLFHPYRSPMTAEADRAG